ncbi:putative transcriptional regulator, TetR family protein [Dictyobacter alpinus]|uniref:Putative transcriptional regulator, TetR family protein n=1 Tax=Dictyobacter alpinus TaxID=2014873 RepID=A0A402BEA4_9CHLR|nr:TetR/AcrR family transcriptional regulator [Dictyobacter alpinus]GCE29728.1 putative transcriptional regulator, TetR family protein [Dictyobacter alpinus]
MTKAYQANYNLTMESKNKPDGQKALSFIEATRRAQIIACAIETIATLGYAQASVVQIAKRAGTSKGVVFYHFTDKETLIEQVVNEVYSSGTQYMEPRIKAQTTAVEMLKTYIQTNLEFIGSHRMYARAIAEIMANYRTEGGKLRYDVVAEEPVRAIPEMILRKGQRDGLFKAFDPFVMAVTLRRAIDAVPAMLEAYPELDLDAYTQELITIFDQATRKN